VHHKFSFCSSKSKFNVLQDYIKLYGIIQFLMAKGYDGETDRIKFDGNISRMAYFRCKLIQGKSGNDGTK